MNSSKFNRNNSNNRQHGKDFNGKSSEIDTHETECNSANKPKLKKMSSIEHVTPKEWTTQPRRTSEKKQWKSVRPSYLKDQEDDQPHNHHQESSKRTSAVQPSTFSSERLRADKTTNESEARFQKHWSRDLQSYKTRGNSQTEAKQSIISSSSTERLQSEKLTNKPEAHYRRNKPKDINLLHVQNPRMAYRPSFNRDRKSPGFGTLRRMWDEKANQSETNHSNALSNKQKSVTVPRMPRTWHNTRKSYEKKKDDTSCDPQIVNVDLLSPKPFRSGSIDNNKHYSFKSASYDTSKVSDSETQTISGLQSEENQTASEEMDSESNLSDDEKSESAGEKTLSRSSSMDHSDDHQIAAIRSDILNDISDHLDHIDVGVYGGFEDDESETEIDAIVYGSQETDVNLLSTAMARDQLSEVSQSIPPHDVSPSQLVEAPKDASNMPPDYLPMASQPENASEMRYLDMTGNSSQVTEVDYGEHFVAPPPLIPSKTKREYHEIDPNIPPPPRHNPPRLPLDKKPPIDSEPPPLPPANTTGRRSRVYTNKMKHEILQNLHENSAPNSRKKNTKKLKYVEVEVGPPSSALPVGRKKTSYSDVLIISDNSRNQRDRSGSGTSEDGLANAGNKKHSTTKPILPSFFAKKEPKSSPSKGSQENLADFEKERNKKKRISGRFLRKKTKTEIKNKKETENRSSQNSECDPETSVYVESGSTTTSETSINRLSGNAPGSSSTTTSPGTSGDGEVGGLPFNKETSSTAESKYKWKVLPTPSTTAETTESYKPIPQPRTTSMNNHKRTFSPTGRNSTFLAYPPANTNLSSTIGNGVHDDQPKVVPSFLHGASKKSTSDTNLNGSRAKPPPPVPPHRKTSAPSMETDLDAPSCGQELRTNAAPVPLPGLTPATSPRTLPTVTSSEVQGSLYEAANDSTHVPDVGIYSAADDVPEVDAPPPLPVRDDDDTFYETIVPPSPMPKTEHGYKFLEAEPLYQIYRTRTLTNASSKRRTGDSSRNKSKSEPPKSAEFQSGLLSEDLGTSTLWRSIPEVVQSGLAENMQPDELKLQQSQFEVITSQASYLRSLNILLYHFMDDHAMSITDVLPQSERHHLFSNIETVRKVEQTFLRDLEAHFWQDIKLARVCDLIAQYSKSEFDVYIRYIQNQVYQDRTLTKLQRNNERFGEELCRLEASPACNKLPLLSFLMLPMQRVTRLPLLVSAIVTAADSAGDSEMYKKAKHTLGVVNKLVKKCNDSARSMQQIEQLAEIASQLDYSSSVKMFALVSQSRSLVKKGEMNVSMTTDPKKAPKTNKLWLFLFSDVLFIAKKKSLIDFGSTRFEVIDWANRQFLAVNEHAVTENAIYLVVLENQAGKRIEMSLMPMAQNELSRWETALNPPKYGSLGESIYESWDCPQYSCVEPHQAQQPDELSLDIGDVMQVFKKTADGWLEGERLRDGESGWFPACHCEEIEDEHVRARNMKNLYKTFAAAS